MIQVKERIGNITSSGIVDILATGKGQNGFGAAAISYITECNYERMLGRSISTETDSKPTSWGKLLEPRVFDLLPTSYTYSSKITDKHPTIPYWTGSKDGTNEVENRAVIDIKCPMTLKSFIGLILPLYLGYDGIEAMNCIRNGFTYQGFKYPAHKDGDKFYWQLVSNAIINGLNYGELIVYMPYQSELLEIHEMAKDNPSVKWMGYMGEDSIPSLPDGGMFKNLNIIRFEIPQEDKDLLTNAVLKAGELLIKNTEESIVNA
jgi:hypothetical protein